MINSTYIESDTKHMYVHMYKVTKTIAKQIFLKNDLMNDFFLKIVLPHAYIATYMVCMYVRTYIAQYEIMYVAMCTYMHVKVSRWSQPMLASTSNLVSIVFVMLKGTHWHGLRMLCSMIRQS